jgi:hypothetical protein
MQVTQMHAKMFNIFFEVKLVDVNRVDHFNALTIVRTSTLHQVRSVGLDMILLQARNLSCFYKFYTNGGDCPCDHVNYVPRFDLIYLVPYKPQDARNYEIDEDNCLSNNDRELLVAILDVGDHFIVIVAKDNNKGDDFWVFICEETLARVEEVNKVDYWGQE